VFVVGRRGSVWNVVECVLWNSTPACSSADHYCTQDTVHLTLKWTALCMDWARASAETVRSCDCCNVLTESKHRSQQPGEASDSISGHAHTPQHGASSLCFLLYSHTYTGFAAVLLLRTIYRSWDEADTSAERTWALTLFSRSQHCLAETFHIIIVSQLPLEYRRFLKLGTAVFVGTVLQIPSLVCINRWLLQNLWCVLVMR